MIDFIFDDTISVRRKNNTPLNSLNEPVNNGWQTWNVVYTALPCRREDTSHKNRYNVEGEREVYNSVFYVKADADIQMRDALIASNGQLIGFVRKVLAAKNLFTVDHLEVDVDEE